MRCLIVFLLLLCSCGKSHRPSYEIGMDPSWYPIQIPGKEANLTGFSNELLVDIADKERINFSKINMNWDNLLQGLQQEKYAAILSSMQPFVFLEKQFDFSDPYLLIGPVLVVPVASSATALDNLNGKEVAMVNGETTSALILEKYPGIIIRGYESAPLALNAVADGVIEGAVINVLLAEAYVKDLFNGRLKVATPPLNNDGLRLVILHDKAPDLIRSFNEGLSSLKKDKTYDSLRSKWGL